MARFRLPAGRWRRSLPAPRCSCAFTSGNSTFSSHWAEGPVDAAVPEGRGSWQRAFTALYRRARARVAAQRGLAQRLERFAAAAEAIPEAIVVLDDANRIRFANARARVHSGLGTQSATWAGHSANLVRQPGVIRYLECRRFLRGRHRAVATRARSDAVDPGRAVWGRREALCCRAT